MRFEIRVKPGARRTQVGGTWGEHDALVVAVTARAVDGKANDAVITALADALGVRPRQLDIVTGHRARTKLIELVGSDSDEATRRLAALREPTD